MSVKSSYNNPIGYYVFHVLPRAIIRDLILQEMLSLKDIARLEVAAAIHRLHDEDKVRLSSVSHSCLVLLHRITYVPVYRCSLV
jgi:hypothetical protein